MNRLGFWAAEATRSLTIMMLMTLMVVTAAPAAISRSVTVGSPPTFGIPEFVPYLKDADGFNYGVTIPDATNVGVIPGVTRAAYTGGTSITGSTDSANPTLFTNLNFSSQITVSSGHVRFYNCYFAPSFDNTANACIVSLSANIGRVWAERCTFRPAVPSYTGDGVKGHHVTLRRCDISNTVDGLGSFNTTGPRTDNFFWGCWIHDLCKFDDDGYSAGRPGSHADGTHNDGCQHQGGLGLSIIGNRFDGFNVYADGSRPTEAISLYTGQMVLTQENVAINGVYYCGEFEIHHNFIGVGWNQVFVHKTRSSGGTPYNVNETNNTWLTSSQRNYGGTYKFYNQRTDPQVTINGVNQTVGTAVQYPDDLNRYADVAEVESQYRGQPVYVRRDTTV